MFIISILFKVVFRQGIKCKKEKMIKILFKIIKIMRGGAGNTVGFWYKKYTIRTKNNIVNSTITESLNRREVIIWSLQCMVLFLMCF